MKNLIEKYFNGETSPQEEEALKTYFLSGEVEEPLKEYIPLFQFFAENKQLELSADFDDKLFEKIDATSNQISVLVEKYFDGETSLEEEATIMSYFTSGEVESSLQKYQPLFQYFENEKEVELSAGFDKKFFAKIDGGAKIVQMRSWRQKLMRVAAVVVVLLGAYLFFNKTVVPPTPQVVNWDAYEIHDEQLAYEETVKALKLLSSKLNKGKNKTIEEVVKAEPVTKYLN